MQRTPHPDTAGFPDANALAALRGWYAGLGARASVERYLPGAKADGQSSRSMLSQVRRQLSTFARVRHREDLLQVFEHTPDERIGRAKLVIQTIDALKRLPKPVPICLTIWRCGCLPDRPKR